MKRSILCSLVFVMFLGVAACGDDDSAVDGAPIVLTDAAVPDATPVPDAAPPIDASRFPIEQAVGIDEMRITGGPAFAPLGPLANGQIQGMIDDGSLLLALGFRDLDDASGQDDTDVTLAFYQCEDPDFDGSDNFNAADPDEWVVSAASIDGTGNPLVSFPGATLTQGALLATSATPVVLPGLPIPIEIHEPRITGVAVASGDSTAIDFLDDGIVGKETITAELVGAMTAGTLGAAPNIASGFCPGDSLLDVLALGCSDFGLAGNQPDADLVGGGLEKFCDACGLAPCEIEGGSMTEDGIIDCCIDEDETVVEGAGCATDSRFGDGFTLELGIHGTRVILYSYVDPS
jgi:hypothetical protein